MAGHGLTIGILGHGSIGRRHHENVIRLGHDVMIYDPTYPGRTRGSVLRLADAVIIASPTPQHYRDILDCIEDQKPMLIEKPLIEPHPGQLQIVTERLKLSGLPAYMGFNLRFHAAVQRAKEWLPRIGRTINADFTVAQKSTKPSYLRDGVTNNWLSHELDICTWLLGPGKIVAAEINEQETVAELKVDHDGGHVSRLYADYLEEPEIRRFSINGTNGQLACNIVTRQCAIWTGDKHNAILERSTDNWDQNYRDEVEDWIGQIQGREGRCANWEQGAAVQKMVIDARAMGGVK